MLSLRRIGEAEIGKYLAVVENIWLHSRLKACRGAEATRRQGDRRDRGSRERETGRLGERGIWVTDPHCVIDHPITL